MCRDCRHWKRSESHTDHGTLFAPCWLKPDRIVSDKRAPGGNVEQGYVMAGDYVCGSYRKMEVAA